MRWFHPVFLSVVTLWATLTRVGEPAATDSLPARTWPVDARPAVSSNFCEYREGHLHAGIDVRTFGEEGIACLTPAPGYVSRMRASADGYGKALYVQLETGETLVYAHLAEFAPEFEAALRDVQERSGRYRVDIRFSPDRFPLSAQEVVGYSGSTGATAPHLHFEVRDERENPLDPFAHGFMPRDQLAPVFETVRVLPIRSDGRVDGACFPTRATATRSGEHWVIAETLHVAGAVGISVEAHDRLNDISGRLAPAEMSLSVDGQRVALIRFDRFSFANTSQVDFVYEAGRIRVAKEYFIQLYARRGESLWDREFIGDGELLTGADAGRHVHEARVEATDRAGNSSTLVFHFRSSAEAPRRARSVWNSRVFDEIPGVFTFESVFATRAGVAGYPVDTWAGLLGLAPAGESWVAAAASLPAVPVGLPINTAPGAPMIYVTGVPAGEPRSLRFSELEFEAIIAARSLYTDHAMYATRWVPDVTDIRRGELVPRTEPLRVGPYSITLAADMELRFTSGQYDSSDAIYRLNEEKGEWVHYESLVLGSVVTTTVRRPGVYAVLSDRYGPRIRKPILNDRKSYATGKQFAQLVVPMEDAGSGVDDERTTIDIGGNSHIARWDFVSKKMFIDLPDGSIIGLQTVTVIAFDKIGNRSRLDATVDFR